MINHFLTEQAARLDIFRSSPITNSKDELITEEIIAFHFLQPTSLFLTEGDGKFIVRLRFWVNR